MSVRTYNGSVLVVGGAVATSDDCCCDPVCCKFFTVGPPRLIKLSLAGWVTRTDCVITSSGHSQDFTRLSRDINIPIDIPEDPGTPDNECLPQVGNPAADVEPYRYGFDAYLNEGCSGDPDHTSDNLPLGLSVLCATITGGISLLVTLQSPVAAWYFDFQLDYLFASPPVSGLMDFVAANVTSDCPYDNEGTITVTSI